MTKTLTKQWREGKLPEGLYYIEGKGNYDIALIRNRYCPVLTSSYCENTVFESEFVPVAPVPSYDEYKQLVSKTERLENRLEIATKALEELETKSDKFDNSWSVQEQLDFIKAKCQETLYQIKEMEGVK